MNHPSPSSCVLLLRRDQFFWAMRPTTFAFLGGFHAFPGGGVEPGDEDTPISGVAEGDPIRTYVGCAAREVFEEVGLLALTSGVIAASAPSHGVDWPALRERVLADEVTLASALLEAGLEVDGARYEPVGEWTTPEFVPRRFQTEFFTLRLEDGEPGGVGGEPIGRLVHAAEIEHPDWVTPEQALALHESATALVSAPTLALIRALARPEGLGPESRCDQAGREETVLDCELPGGLMGVPLRSPTLYPATHTNCYIVGAERFVIIDPGSAYTDQLEFLFEVIDWRIARGDEPVGVLLTHHHVDHVSGLEALVARYRKPWALEVMAHAQTARLVAQANMGKVTRELADGERVELGEESLECVFTPGHAPGHLAFVHERTGLVISGDMVASVGTILVSPPDGHMGDYLASLERLRALGARALLPAHGFVIADAEAKLVEYREHRQAREDRVEAALIERGGWCEAMDLVAQVYSEVPEAIWPIASFSLFAHLVHLAELGKAERDGDRFSPPGAASR